MMSCKDSSAEDGRRNIGACEGRPHHRYTNRYEILVELIDKLSKTQEKKWK